ncbi:MAG TPA: class I SAM-dependent methyltransferase [Blastocatellia bacterium]|nr:class I SAM-dependent methyltransferase [Blastocatellia bacterium]
MCASSKPGFAEASFRDPSGRLVRLGDRIIRIVGKEGIFDLKAFLSSSTASKFLNSKNLVGTTFISDAEVIEMVRQNLPTVSDQSSFVEHERIPFQSFPYEWPAEMLYKAGSLTLDLSESLLAEGLGLKDATPYNVLYRGSTPVFIDLLSFEKRSAGNPTWLPSAQFQRTFLLPLLVNKYFSIPLDQIFMTSRDGLEPESVYNLSGTARRLLPPFLSMVSIPTWLGKSATSKPTDQSQTIYQEKSSADPEKTKFILQSLFRRLRRSLEKVAPDPDRKSTWSGYMLPNASFSDSYFAAKNAYMSEVIQEFKIQKVLDVGCNTGHFSFMAAKAGASVVAIDYDPVVIGKVWRQAESEKLNILPLVVNLSRPTPSTGWRNSECPAFLDRARGSFDAVFMLAVIHHMLVSERIPLDEIIDLASELTTDLLVIEFVPNDDPLFRVLTRGREHLHTDFTKESFEASLNRKFDIVRSQRLAETGRVIYVLRKKA